MDKSIEQVLKKINNKRASVKREKTAKGNLIKKYTK